MAGTQKLAADYAKNYLDTADVWAVLDLIVAEFESDPMSVQCFDARLVARAKELNRQRRATVPGHNPREQAND